MNTEKQIDRFFNSFGNNIDRQKKYTELLLLKDEASPFSYQRRNNLRRIAIGLTTKCNLKCIWCQRSEGRLKDYLGKEMPLDMFRDILPTLKGFLWLHIGGLGEPLLYPHIFDVIKETKQYIPNVKVTTNGVLLTKEYCNRLIEAELSYLEISIDGFDHLTHKKIRGIDEDKLIDNLKYFSDNSDIPIQVNSVIADTNYNSLFEAVDRLKEINNIVLLHTIPLFPTTHSIKLGIQETTAEEHRRLLLHWKKRARELSLKFDIWPDLQETGLDPIIVMKRKHNLCFPVYDDPFINVLGYLCPCCRAEEICLDNIADLGFDAAWNGPKMIEWRKRQLKGDYPEICQRECHMRNTCIKDIL